MYWNKGEKEEKRRTSFCLPHYKYFQSKNSSVLQIYIRISKEMAGQNTSPIMLLNGGNMIKEHCVTTMNLTFKDDFSLCNLRGNSSIFSFYVQEQGSLKVEVCK